MGACGAFHAGAGAFQKPRQFGEDGGGVAFAGGRFAGGQADLALGHGKARHQIHQQQHIQARVAQAASATVMAT